MNSITNELNEIRKKLEESLGDDLKRQYFNLLKQWFLFKGPITKTQFDTAVRRLMTNEEQIRNHNMFILALYAKTNYSYLRDIQNSSDKGCFEMADYTEYVSPSKPSAMPSSDFENRSAASELFLPDSGFMSARITVNVWENGLEEAEEGVTEVMVNAVQIFVKNIITAMISRKRGYKIRDGKFQHSFGIPPPDPFLRNTNHIIDHTQESKVDISSEGDSFVPSCRVSLENAEHQTAFAYSCGTNSQSDNLLTVKLLYDTIRDNPSIIGLHSIHSINLLKLGLQVEDPVQ